MLVKEEDVLSGYVNVNLGSWIFESHSRQNVILKGVRAVVRLVISIP